jgi:hypothetical protein
MARRTSEEVEMTRKLSIAIAAGLMLAGPAFAADQDQTRTKDQAQDQTRDQTKDQAGTHTSAGIGAQVKVLAKDQKPGDGTNGIGEQVRTMAQSHGCDVNGSAECKARLAAHEALAEKAGSPTDKPALPSAAADRGQMEHSQTRTRAHEAEQAAMRHSERKAAGQDVDDMHSNGHRAGHGDGHGMGDSMQGAETKRSGDAHPMGTGGGMTPGGGMH